MEMPLVVETLRDLQPVERDTFLIGLGSPAPIAPAPVAPDARARLIPPPPKEFEV